MPTPLHDQFPAPARGVVVHHNGVIVSDIVADDSDKALTVPDHFRYHLHAVFVKLVTTATGGNRQITLQIRDDTDQVVLEIPVGATQAASLTRYYSFAPGLPDLTAFRGGNSVLLTPLPGVLVLPQGWDIRIFDDGAVDAAADDMEIHLFVDKINVSQVEA